MAVLLAPLVLVVRARRWVIKKHNIRKVVGSTDDAQAWADKVSTAIRELMDAVVSVVVEPETGDKVEDALRSMHAWSDAFSNGRTLEQLRNEVVSVHPDAILALHFSSVGHVVVGVDGDSNELACAFVDAADAAIDLVRCDEPYPNCVREFSVALDRLRDLRRLVTNGQSESGDFIEFVERLESDGADLWSLDVEVILDGKWDNRP